jgi:hypothetical protein
MAARRALIVLVIVLAAALAARVAAPAPKRHSHFSAALACGVERWSIKTLKDRPRLLPARPTTVAYLTSRPRPPYLPATRRLPFERRIYSVIARVTLVRPEDDSDYHLVLRSGSRTMIAEAPSPLCTKGATPLRRKQMSAARNRVRVCAKARVSGVAFFDFIHGQTGVAPNGIELHPILGFACLSNVGPPQPPPPPSGGKCAASYPTVCIPPPPPDLDCADIPYRNFKVRWDVPDPDPQHFDGNHDGVGCES